MKHHITEKQLNELTDKQLRVAGSFYRRQGGLKPKFGIMFWNIGRMIEYLNEAVFMTKVAKLPIEEGQWYDYYGFNISATPQEEWCDKLWEKVKKTLYEEYDNSPPTRWSI